MFLFGCILILVNILCNITLFYNMKVYIKAQFVFNTLSNHFTLTFHNVNVTCIDFWSLTYFMSVLFLSTMNFLFKMSIGHRQRQHLLSINDKQRKFTLHVFFMHFLATFLSSIDNDYYCFNLPCFDPHILVQSKDA